MNIQFASFRKVCSIFALLVLLVLLAVAARPATAQIIQIIQYGTQEVGGGTPTPTASSVKAINPGPGVTGTDVVRGTALTSVSASYSINSSGWNVLSSNAYYQFGFTTTVSYMLDTFTVGLRSSATGAGWVDLNYSKDGGAFVSLTSVDPIELVGTSYDDLAINLSSIGQVNSSLVFQIVADSTHFTNAGYNQTPTGSSTISSTGTFRFTSYDPGTGVNVDPTITGHSVSAVPEPSALSATGLAFLCVVGVRGRRRLRLACK